MSLILQGARMWGKYLSKRVEREAILKFVMNNGESYEGVVTGIDQEWLQICTLEMDCVNLNLVNISTVSDTPKSVKDAFRGAENRGRVRRLTERIREAAQ